MSDVSKKRTHAEKRLGKFAHAAAVRRKRMSGGIIKGVNDLPAQAPIFEAPWFADVLDRIIHRKRVAVEAVERRVRMCRYFDDINGDSA